MDKLQINENEYIELVNKKIKDHELYEDGMKIELFPEHSNRASGYNILGGSNANLVAAWATKCIDSEYELKLSK